MGAYGQGLEYLNRLREEQGLTGEKREWTKNLWLMADGDTAVMWFVTDGDQIFVAKFHEEERKSKKGSTWKADILCKGEDCSRCSNREDSWIKCVALVYVECIDHKKQDDKEWKAVARGKLTRYREDVGDYRLWMIKSKMQPVVYDKFGEYGTFTDCYWELKRNGNKGGQISYEFSKTAVSNASDRCVAALASAPDITELVIENYSDRKKSPKTVEAKEGVFEYSPVGVGEDEEPVNFEKFD